MQTLFTELPWWLNAGLMGGFGIMTAFVATVLPSPWHGVGFSIGLLMFLSACAGSVWHGINATRQKAGKPRVSLEPYIIPVGSALILIGAAMIGYGVWQGYGFFSGRPQTAAASATTAVPNAERVTPITPIPITPPAEHTAISWTPSQLDQVVQVEKSQLTGEPRITLIKM
jgi:hypothetical protein